MKRPENRELLTDIWFLVSGFWFPVSGFEFLVSGFEFLVSGFVVEAWSRGRFLVITVTSAG
jgi:hypothetical protein